MTGEEETDQGYKAPVNTKEEKNHNETKAKYQAKAEARVQDEATELSTEAAKLKSFQARDQVHGQVSQLYQVRYLAGADAGAQAVKEHSQPQEHQYQAKNEKEEPKYQAGELTREAAQLKSFQAKYQGSTEARGAGLSVVLKGSAAEGATRRSKEARGAGLSVVLKGSAAEGATRRSIEARGAEQLVPKYQAGEHGSEAAKLKPLQSMEQEPPDIKNGTRYDEDFDTHTHTRAYFKSIKGHGKKVTEGKGCYAMGLAVTIEVTHWPLPRPTTGRGGKYLAPLTRPAPAPTGPGCWSPGLLEPKTASGCTGRGHHRDKINRPLRGKGPGKGGSCQGKGTS